ncbi:MAG: cysteine desulfurase, partial [Candidatus Eremiobacteraeota bacterium]|nr:cysteine desulfurase [Candidatus Eremiobacteraeota bacterium]
MPSTRIYADHAATTPARPEVVEAMLPHFIEGGFNPSSIHAEGRRARTAVDQARATIANCLHAQSKEIVFTGGGSEADNLALFGAARANAARGKHIISTRIEHHAVLHTLEVLAQDGWAIDYLDVDEHGLVRPEAFGAALRADTVLATIMLANNEIGTLQPIAQLARIARERHVLFHTDAVQAPAFLTVDVAELGVDLLSISAHKFYGPKGVGALFVAEGTPLAAHVVGGSQEFAKRAGTENVAGIVGMATALELACAEREEAAGRVQA